MGSAEIFFRFFNDLPGTRGRILRRFSAGFFGESTVFTRIGLLGSYSMLLLDRTFSLI